MKDFNTLETYKKYLKIVQKYLDDCFENQKEYLSCQKGCSHCCERGAYPYSHIEFDYLLIGFFKLDFKEQQNVIKRIKDLKNEYKDIEDKKNIMYRCPFLNDEKICTVYEYRGLICRIFGLLKTTENNRIVIPFCNELGLNYSKIYDRKNKKIDEELVENGKYKNRPKVYDLSFKKLMCEDLIEGIKLDFGEIRSLIDWL